MNNSVKGLPTTPTPGFCSVQSGIPLFSCTVRKRQRQIFKGVVVKTPNLLCEEMVILLEKWLEHHRFYQVSVCVLSHFSCVRLCGPMDCSLAGLSIHGILQVRILGWVAMPSCRGFSWPRGQTLASYVSGIARWIHIIWTNRIACLMGLFLYSGFLFMGDCMFAEMMSN